ncbi:CFC_HP_G0021200.mRNA.1.CDS.1 [Saccharomyces cerevisiae]|nr:ATV_HP_G0106880.mRNA.1.CDS.1 [Saccharomyces cerevisiae]CAI4988727.1 ATV_HP_G0130870.mRNA.1.CDS.1 [Saccharomyces cerevisiae]CAI4989020.1 CFC_HP_G0092070.mRNA.1.CDS.1 [Saccharomyces cerevisiae]CAI5023439.1 CFC_HP_G0021200.mRNA.1.CDS.1 [Saccharomyces cerevisiae]CAI5205709.1 BTE_HP_G0152480.mRNA.1.CDS.1 [Saccharomyces cerevisiae]
MQVEGPDTNFVSDLALGSKKRRLSKTSVQEDDHTNVVSEVNKNKKKKKAKPMTCTLLKSVVEKGIGIKDVRDMTQYLLQAENNSPKWIDICNRSSLQKMIVLFIPGLQPDDFENGKNTFNEISDDNFKYIPGEIASTFHTFPVMAPGSKMTLFSPYNSFINVGLSKMEKINKLKELQKKKKITINDLVLSEQQLVANDYPLDSGDTNFDTDWVQTVDFTHGGSHIFALDCEMCLSEQGLVLTRISLVNFDNEVIYEELVKPDVPIVDYLTRYSGITEEKLTVGAKKTLREVQKDLLKIISRSDILIGHSLQNDLKVMKLKHPLVVDTAIIYHHKAGDPFKPSLKYLSETFLNKSIQNGEHDSVEDARACLELTKLKILNGLAFGIGINTENLFTKVHRFEVKTVLLNDMIIKNHTEDDSKGQLIRCVEDDETWTHIHENLNKDVKLIVGRIKNLERSRNYNKKPRKETPSFDASMVLHDIGQHLTQLYENATPGTMILIMSGTGDTRPWNNLSTELEFIQDKKERLDKRREREPEIVEAIKLARGGVASFTVK